MLLHDQVMLPPQVHRLSHNSTSTSTALTGAKHSRCITWLAQCHIHAGGCASCWCNREGASQLASQQGCFCRVCSASPAAAAPVNGGSEGYMPGQGHEAQHRPGGELV